MNDFDGTYHLLFSHAELVVQLVRDFVPEPWVADLDLAAMSRVNAKFHTDDATRREGDVIWRIPSRRGGFLYLYLLLQFQSASEAAMAVRVGAYIMLLYQHLIREREVPAAGPLPPVFPVVLYNGTAPWTAATALHALIGLPEESPLWYWQPQARYYLLDEGRCDIGARGGDSLAAILFALEQGSAPSEILAVVERLVTWFRHHPGHDTLKAAFTLFLRRAVLEPADPAVALLENLEEMQTMLATRVKEWRERWEQQGIQAGIQKGLEKGIQKGIQQGEAKIVLSQLERRFGPLPTPLRQRVAEGTPEQLEQWSHRLLDAASLEAVFL